MSWAEPQSMQCEIEPRPFVIFAASSTKDILEEAALRWSRIYSKTCPNHPAPPPTIAIGPSATLARQITLGAPAHIFISAHPRWITYVKAELGLHEAPLVLADGRLAFVSGARQKIRWECAEVKAMMATGHFIIADPAVAPAGRYALQALESLLGQEPTSWQLAMTPSARHALALIKETKRPGLIYASQAIQHGLENYSLVPKESHPQISYQALNIAPGHPFTSQFLAWLKSESQRPLWQLYGFDTPAPD